MQYIDAQSEKVPALGYGTWQLKGKDCVSGVKKALGIGYRHIDTAQAYDNEAEVGLALEESGVARSEIFLTTKIWMDNFPADKFNQSLDESLSKLRTDYVNMLLLHWPDEHSNFDHTLELLLEAKKAGKTRLIGVSNYTVELMKRAQTATKNTLVTNQVEFHPYIDQGPVLEWIRRHDMFLTGYSPLSRGDVLKNQTIQDIGKRYNKSPGQITLRWALQHEKVAVIPKAASEKHMESNFNVFDFELTQEEMDDITGLAREDGRKVNPDFAPEWDTAKAA